MGMRSGDLARCGAEASGAVVAGGKGVVNRWLVPFCCILAAAFSRYGLSISRDERMSSSFAFSCCCWGSCLASGAWIGACGLGYDGDPR